MWQRFTESARKVVFYAQEEAQHFGEGYVSTEHLLLGLLRETDNTGSKALAKMGISPNRVVREVRQQLPKGDARPSQDMTLTPRAKRVIDLSYDEARNFGHNYIGTEHLLLGLVREGDGLAGLVLAKVGIEMQQARNAVAEILDQPAPPDRASAPHAPSKGLTFMPWLNGACLYEHLAITLLADQNLTVLRHQVADPIGPTAKLMAAIQSRGNLGISDTGNASLTDLLSLANEEAGGENLQPVHLLLALLRDDLPWDGRRLLIEAGASYEEARRLLASTPPPPVA